MNIKKITPPRVFTVGMDNEIDIKDCARIYLEPNEQITLIDESKGEFDIVRKPWGYYATPSLNGRLKQFGYRSALVKSHFDKYYILLVESKKENDFLDYLKEQKMSLTLWLDDNASLKKVGGEK